MLFRVDIELEMNGNINPMSLSQAVIESGIERQVMKAALCIYESGIVRELQKDGWSRDGTRGRTIITKIGKIGMRVQRMKRGRKTCYPLLPDLGIAGKERYCGDVQFDCADAAVKMTYRDAEDESSKGRMRVSKSTIHRLVQKVGKITGRKNDEEAGVHGIAMGDGTKAHGMNGKKNEINVVIGCSGGGKELMGLTVNRSWNAMGKGIRSHAAERITLISDAERAIRNGIENENFQLDTYHIISEVSYKLWEAKAPKEDKKAILDELKSILCTLINSVKKHAADGDMERLEWRVEKTLDDLRLLAEIAWKKGYRKVDRFIRNSANHMVTFARLLIKTGQLVPHTSNMIERLMGEIAKRIKNKWMHWSEKGLQNLLNMLLVRYCSRERYKKIWKEVVYGNGSDIKIGVNIRMEGGKSTYFGT